jgi:hypothetical protein
MKSFEQYDQERRAADEQKQQEDDARKLRLFEELKSLAADAAAYFPRPPHYKTVKTFVDEPSLSLNIDRADHRTIKIVARDIGKFTVTTNVGSEAESAPRTNLTEDDVLSAVRRFVLED